jgi:hypothetical protein
VRGTSLARRLRAALLAVIAALYVLSIPWYRRAGAEISLWFGLPDWVAVALLCYAAVAVVNTFAWALTDIPDGDGRSEGERR